MTDTVIVTDPKGLPIDKLRVAIMREQKLDRTLDAEKGTFTMSTSDPKATAINLKRNNFVYITSDIVGIEPWCGLIWPPENGLQVNPNGEYVVTLRSCEWKLGQRMTAPLEKIPSPMTSGEVFVKLLEIAQREGAFPISSNLDDVVKAGGVMQPVWNKANIYDIVNKLAVATGFYWHFTPSRNENTGELELKPYWKNKIGSYYKIQLIQRKNLNNAILSEKTRGKFANKITAIGKFSNWATPIIYTEQDDESVSMYGVIEDTISAPTITTVEGLKPVVRAELIRRKPRLFIAGTLTEPPYPQVGDYVQVIPDYGGSYLAAVHGAIVRMRVQHAGYSPADETVAVKCEEVFDGE